MPHTERLRKIETTLSDLLVLLDEELVRGRAQRARLTDGVFSRSEPQNLRAVGLVTPSGIESTPSVTKPREDSSSPTENRGTTSSKRPVVTLSGSKVAKLAAIARHAVGNYDLTRALEVLEELRRLGEGRSR
jgi:hypothetical protein